MTDSCRASGRAARRMLAACLWAASVCALAGWEQVGGNDAIYLFADRNSLRKEDTMARMTHLVDFRLRPPENGTNYQSAKIEAEYDCSSNRFQETTITYYPYRMAEGAMIGSTAPAVGWQAIAAGSSAELLADIACGRSKKTIKEREKKRQ